MDKVLENYDEDVTFNGYGGNEITEPRLRIGRNALCYGYSIIDTKRLKVLKNGNFDTVIRNNPETVDQ